MFTLAMPVVMAELGWMTMGLVDTLMVGGIGPEAIGAVGIGSSLFMGVCIFAMGLFLGLDTRVAQAFGAGRVDECHRWLAYRVVLSVGLSVPVTNVVLLLSSALGRWGLHPTVLQLTQPYLNVLAWSIPPLLLYASFRRYLQGMGVVRPVMIALVLANVLNACVNWILIFGHLGAPRWAYVDRPGPRWSHESSWPVSCWGSSSIASDRLSAPGFAVATASLSRSRVSGDSDRGLTWRRCADCWRWACLPRARSR